jgi:hypothetical protein
MWNIRSVRKALLFWLQIVAPIVRSFEWYYADRAITLKLIKISVSFIVAICNSAFNVE